MRIGMPGGIGDTGIGLIRPKIDVDARIDQEPNRIEVPFPGDDMQSGKTMPFRNRVHAFLEHRRQDSRVTRLRGFEPNSGVKAIWLLDQPGASGCRLARGEISKQQCWTAAPEMLESKRTPHD